MQKPRPYNGPVDWIDHAKMYADTWHRQELEAVKASFPYALHPNRVRMEDWVALVAHVSLTRREDPLQAAERLAMYVSTYRERYGRHLSPDTVRKNQT